MISLFVATWTLAISQNSPIECGVATTVFTQTPSAAVTAVGTGKLSFWWNWDTTIKVDTNVLDSKTVSALRSNFVPMVWGTVLPVDMSFLEDHEGDVMGYNEPDQYGPACCNCDGKQSYYPATSSGWAPVFNPKSASTAWQTTVKQLTAAKKNGSPSGVTRIISPAMAGVAMKQPGVDCTIDPATPGASHFCAGWLSMFKNFTLQLECESLTGETSNCWDVIDAIQIHAYAYKASDVHDKLRSYYNEFEEDFEGKNGRKKKVLWLTEVAAASSDSQFVSSFAADLMSTSTGLGNRASGAQGGFGYVSHVSWFNEYFFSGFNVTGHNGVGESWVSTLFNPFGGLTDAGTAFFKNCATA